MILRKIKNLDEFIDVTEPTNTPPRYVFAQFRKKLKLVGTTENVGIETYVRITDLSEKLKDQIHQEVKNK